MLRRLWVIAAVLMLYASTTYAQEVTETPLSIDLTPPTLGDFQESSVSDIVLADHPTLPELTDTAKAIFASGQAAGRNPHMFSKIGDCMTAADYFLNAFGGKDYDLGTFTNLQPVVDYFSAGHQPFQDQCLRQPRSLDGQRFYHQQRPRLDLGGQRCVRGQRKPAGL